jgi:ribosomal protein L40E
MCNAKNASGAKFCNECGQKLVSATINCPQCGAVLSGSAKFCNECGAKLN